ncbi:17beta-estradiol 17-dehydrogenase / very-long-chain 3-oxoacyl-CoA reductase [Nematocida minor]|uniref:17beta-estradiol 17-dehydrogenase / very-long-chain 3-oxoacyl-CoA reductase n=1 Tax=Nematocida minor TaxID=1912983 RepID=UPI002220C173|nr:17beta-estradiol 17-dehydrogenase / very-long-chain 3-oxoacyl-CoA reductase [Nematocida minor]KAI5189882.1 17beta-estradiol 17-dehydrogenase / very-long-chain 3-oxoacyl-CoA reductase [Nematocida minor]
MFGCFIRCLATGAIFLAFGNLSLFLFAEIFLVLYRRMHNKIVMKKLAGKWGIVTGCTDGIGLGMARELAAQGVNLVLISRSTEKLQKLQEELSPKIKVEIVAIDFENEEIDFSNVLSGVKKYSPHILINNVGVNASKPTAFMEHTQNDIDRIIKVNIINTLKITREYLAWDAFPSEKKYVLSTGSMLGSMPSPFQQVYAGTKAFLQVWSESMSTEIPRYHFELLMTGLVCSKLSGAKRPNIFTPSSDAYGKACIHSFGSASITYPYFPHYLLSLLTALIPRRIIGLALDKVGRGMRARKQRSSRKTE